MEPGIADLSVSRRKPPSVTGDAALHQAHQIHRRSRRASPSAVDHEHGAGWAFLDRPLRMLAIEDLDLVEVSRAGM
jgi:hypothetical protein